MSEVVFPQFKLAVKIFMIIFTTAFSLFSFWMLGLPLLPDQMIGLKKLFPDPLWATIIIVCGYVFNSLLFGKYYLLLQY